MKHTYIAKFRINLGKAIPEIDEVLKDINDAVASSHGVDEKLSLWSEDIISPLSITVNRELTEREQEMIKSLLTSDMQEHPLFKKYDVRLASFSRQSGNVSQEVPSVP